MAITQVITALPTAPDPATMTAAVFSSTAAASVLAQKAMTPELNTFATQANALATTVNDDKVTSTAQAALATSQAALATAAAAAALSTANTTLWVSGTSYSVGNTVYSPINVRSYRRLVAGAGTTDPSADATNWTLLGGGLSVYDLATTTGTWVCPATGYYKITVQDGGNSGATNSGISRPGASGGAAGVRLLLLTAGITYTRTVGAAGAINGAGTTLGETAGGASSFSGSGITTLTSSNATFKAAGGSANGTTGSGPNGASFMSPNSSSSGASTIGYGTGSGSTSAGAAGSAGMPGAVLIEG